MDVREISIAHLCRRGLDEFGLRGLSHGRFTGVILTRNIAETVLLAQIQKRLREDNIDVDATIVALYKSRNMKAPDKVKEAANYVAPFVEEFFTTIKPWTQVKNYGTKNYDTDNQAAQRIQQLEEEAAKYKQRFRSAGIDVTPQKTLPIAPIDDGSHTATSSQQAPPAQQDPPAKRRRLQRGDNKRRCEQMIQEPFNVIKQSGQSPPTSMTSLKSVDLERQEDPP